MQHNENLTAPDFIHRGNAFFIHGHFKDAISQYTNAIIKTPIGSNSSLVYLYSYRASAHFYLQNYSKAISDLTKAILLDPNNSVLRINRANAHTANGQSDKASIDMQDAVYLIQKNLQAMAALNNTQNQLSVTTNSIFNSQSHRENHLESNTNNDVFRP
jgi:tetratricopeptide (TPR) repeat protein